MNQIKTVLVTDGNIRKTLAVVRSLGNKYKVIVISDTKYSIAGSSKYTDKNIVLLTNSENYTIELIKICKQYKVNYLICPQEETLIKLSKCIDEIKRIGVIPTFPEFEILDKALNKEITLQIASSAGVMIPKTIIPNSIENLYDECISLGFPLVLKPKRSIFEINGKIIKMSGPSYISSEQQLKNYIKFRNKEIDLPLIQEYIDGKGEGGFFLVDNEGAVRLEFAHKRIRDVNPTGSGSSLRKSIKIDPTLRNLSVILLNAMKWSGIAMVEFRKCNKSGQLYLMEVNGRFWGSLALATEAGINFPDGLINIYECPKFNGIVPNYKKNVFVRWVLGDVLRFARIMKGKPIEFPGTYPSRIEGILEFFSLKNILYKNEVLSFKDPFPFLFELIQGFKKAF